MKKILALVLSVMLCFCFVACSGEQKEQTPQISSAVTESETSSFESSDSADESSEASASGQSSTSSKGNSTTSKNTTTSSKASVDSDKRSSKKSSSKNDSSSNSSVVSIPNELLAGIVSRPTVKEEDKVTLVETSSKTASVAPSEKITSV